MEIACRAPKAEALLSGAGRRPAGLREEPLQQTKTEAETASVCVQNLNFELIAECTSLPLEKIQQLAKELQQSN